MAGIRLSGMASGLDTENIVKELMKAQRLKTTKIEKNITSLEWKQDKWKSLNSKVYSLYTGGLTQLKMQGSFNAKKASSTDESKVTATVSNSVPEGNHSVEVIGVANAQYITGKKLDTTASYSTTLKSLGMEDSIGSTLKIAVGDKAIKGGTSTIELKITENTTIGDVVASLQDAGVNASFDTANQRFFISAKSSGMENAFTITSDSEEFQFDKLGLSSVTASFDDVNGKATITVGDGVSKVDPSDSIIIYNGAKIRGSSNNISVNGMNITVKEKTTSPINIAVNKDTQATYDMIKGFIKSYNDVLKELNDAYNADSSKGYSPLTDEEKEAMSEDQITKWEDKIKASLLRRDGTLGDLINTIRTTMIHSVNVNGKSYSLASFGINSIAYTEKGILHIAGDKDDALSASGEEKLMKAITDNPEAIMEVFTKLSGKLYNELNTKMKSNSLRSALNVYNDKEIKDTITNYKSDLSTLESKLSKMEDRYYKQFTAMEKAMSQLNSRSSSLASLLGTNSNS